MRNYVAYFRVSRKEQGISGLGLAAQKSAVTKYVDSQNGKLIQEFTEIETGTNKKVRVEINNAIQLAKKEGAILVIAKLDRLARNVNFVSSLMDAHVEFVASDMPSANNFTIHIFSALAEAEAKLISTRTKQALSELKKKGKKLGTPKNLTQDARKKGVKTIKENASKNDKNRQAISLIDGCMEKNMTYQQIADHLNDLNFSTRYGNQFFANSVYQLVNRKFK